MDPQVEADTQVVKDPQERVEEDFRLEAQVCLLVLLGQVTRVPLEPMVATMVFATDIQYPFGSFLKEIVVLYLIYSIGTNSD
jgi:hypothetical protein